MRQLLTIFTLLCILPLLNTQAATTCHAVLSNVQISHVSTCGAQDGKLDVDPNVGAGTVLPFEVYYTYQGTVHYGGGGFTDYSDNFVTGLAGGSYTDITLVDANGCEDVKHGPFVINEDCSGSTCQTDCSQLDQSINNYMFLGTYNGKAYYKRTTGDVKWNYAQTLAQSLGGTLPIIQDQAHNDWLRNAAGSTGSYWIGYSDANSEGDWEWLNGTSNYENWAPGEPNNTNAQEHYARVKPNGQWTDRKAWNHYWTIVEVDCPCVEAACPVEVTIQNNGGCEVELYHWVPSGDIFIADIPAGGSYTVSTFDHEMWRTKIGPWGSLEFDAHFTVEGCDAQTFTIDPCPAPETECSCDAVNTNIPNYMFLGECNGSLIYKRADGDVDYATAQSYAAELGGTLPVIESQEENECLRALAGPTGSFWTSFTDEGSEGNHYWETGEATSYLNWLPGEPNDSTGLHNNVRVRPDGLWTDKPGSDHYWALIEVPCPCNATCDYVLTCPDSFVFPCNDTRGAFIEWDEPTAPTCGSLAQITGPAQGDLVPEGEAVEITYEFTSDDATVTTCSFFIEVPLCNSSSRLDNANGDCDENSVICNLSATPNPTHGLVQVSYHANYDLEANVTIYNTTGRSFMQKNVVSQTGSNTVDFDLSAYPEGIYYIQVQMRGTTEMVKIVKL